MVVQYHKVLVIAIYSLYMLSSVAIRSFYYTPLTAALGDPRKARIVMVA